MAEASYPADLLYHSEHDWARIDADDPTQATLGITWFAQDALGELVHFEPPEQGATVTAGKPYAEVESVKAVSDVVAPLSGEIVEVNAALSENPAIINEDPYGEGWLVRIRLSDPGEDLSQRHILAPKDISLADPSLLGRGEVAFGYVIDMDDVEAGVDEGRHLAARGLDDQPAGRRRLDVAGSDGGGGVDDDDRQSAFPHELSHHLLGHEFRPLVGPDHVVHAARRLLIGRAARHQTQGRDAARIDDPLDASFQRRSQQVPGSLDIGAKHWCGIADPDPVIGRYVVHVLAPGDGARQ